MSVSVTARGGRASEGGVAPRRWTGVSLSVFGRTIADGVYVLPPDAAAGFPVLGLADFFRHFAVTFRWDQDPPYVVLEPLPAADAAGRPVLDVTPAQDGPGAPLALAAESSAIRVPERPSRAVRRAMARRGTSGWG